ACGSRLQDDRRRNLVNAIMANSGQLIEAWPAQELGAIERLAAPAREHHVGRTVDHLLGLHDALLRVRMFRAIPEDVVAARDLDQLGDPADAGDDRVGPLFEVHARTW